MTATGWTGEGPGGGPAVPVTGFAGFIGSMRGAPEDKPDPLTRARMAPDRPDEPYDDDERQANLMGRGLAPGQVSGLAQRLGDTLAELQGEREKIGKGEKVTARVRGMLEHGQIGPLDAARMMDGDFGDVHRAEQLERRAEGLRRQIGEAAALISPEQRAPDPLEAVNRTAKKFFREVTRQRMAELGTRQANRPAARPFGSISRGSVVVRSELECWHCVQNNVSHEESTLLHLDPAYAVPIVTQQQAEQADQAEQAAHAEQRRHGGSEVIERWPVTYDGAGMAVR